eukprot:8518403-Alexandrium_andersonii.AAC.1
MRPRRSRSRATRAGARLACAARARGERPEHPARGPGYEVLLGAREAHARPLPAEGQGRLADKPRLRGGSTAVVAVDLQALREAGAVIYQRVSEVLLAAGFVGAIPPQYITQVLRMSDKECPVAGRDASRPGARRGAAG